MGATLASCGVRDSYPAASSRSRRPYLTVKSLFVVAEVREDVAPFGAPSLDALGPLPERVVRVVRRIQELRPVKPEIDEVAGHGHA